VLEKLSFRYKEKEEQQVFRGTVTLSHFEPPESRIDSLIRSARMISNLNLPLGETLMAFAIISLLRLSHSIFKPSSTTNLSKLSTEHVKSQLILDEQRRVRESRVGTVDYSIKTVKELEVEDCRKKKKRQSEQAALVWPEMQHQTHTLHLLLMSCENPNRRGYNIQRGGQVVMHAVHLFQSQSESP
jgi:hypothetical protein